MKRIENRDFTRDDPYEVMSREFLIMRGFCCESGCRHCPYKNINSINPTNTNFPKLVSLVPSWTETLLAAGGHVVGCTRYCIHPKDLVQKCLKLGGTKSFNLNKIQELKPDFVIMDREENTKTMAEACPFPLISSHIRSLYDLHKELISFSQKLNLPELQSYAKRIELILSVNQFNNTKNNLNKILKMDSDQASRMPPIKTTLGITSQKNSSNPAEITRIGEHFDETHNDESILFETTSTQEIPGILDWWKKPDDDLSNYHFIYVIWKKPFMCVTQQTYIGSMLSAFGLGNLLWAPQNKGLYPQIELAEIPSKSILLFSSEPYPFSKFKNEYLSSNLPFPAALIDGESYSWYGIRSLRFLEDHLLKD